MEKIIIAIDGYSSCGKTTTAKGVAKALNYRFIDTGAMYRAVTLYMLENNVDVHNENAVNEALESVTIDFEVNEENGSSEILLNGRAVEKQIRNMTVSNMVSNVSKWPAVRHKMVAQQRQMGEKKAIVMDGRDIGTNVFPNAELKVFVTADFETRVARRLLELKHKSEQVDASEIRKNLEERDHIDQTRKENPLRKAEDAILLDTTYMTIDKQIQWVLEKLNLKLESMLDVQIDNNSGYCFGVEFAIQMAEDELNDSGNLYCLGDMVHNDMEVKRLLAKGLKMIDKEEMKTLHNAKVLIRAHGEPPETYKLALENNLELIDASCPVVLKLQNRVKNSFDKSKAQNGQIVIYGKEGHAEVIGLTGQTNDEAIIVTTTEDLDKVDFTRPVTLYSQTTKSTKGFYAIKEEVEKRIKATKQKSELESFEFDANDSICRQVSNREPQLQKFANENDVIIFVSGKKSSNGRALYGVCLAENPRSHFIESREELENEWIHNAKTIGICGATSTPMWLMEDVKEAILELDSQGVLNENE